VLTKTREKKYFNLGIVSCRLFAKTSRGLLIEVEVTMFESEKGAKISYINLLFRHCLADALQVAGMLD
jgi:hypothetical protein